MSIMFTGTNGTTAKMYDPGISALSLALDVDTENADLRTLYRMIYVSDRGHAVMFGSDVMWTKTDNDRLFVRTRFIPN